MMDVVELGYLVIVSRPVALVTADPVALVATEKTVLLGARETVARLRLKAVVERPVSVRKRVPATSPCADAVV
jgi:hypothetical protein